MSFKRAAYGDGVVGYEEGHVHQENNVNISLFCILLFRWLMTCILVHCPVRGSTYKGYTPHSTRGPRTADIVRFCFYILQMSKLKRWFVVEPIRLRWTRAKFIFGASLQIPPMTTPMIPNYSKDYRLNLRRSLYFSSPRRATRKVPGIESGPISSRATSRNVITYRCALSRKLD